MPVSGYFGNNLDRGKFDFNETLIIGHRNDFIHLIHYQGDNLHGTSVKMKSGNRFSIHFERF